MRAGGRAGKRSLLLVALGFLVLSAWTGQAQDCFDGCAAERTSCVRTARVAFRACRAACFGSEEPASLASCIRTCRDGWRQARRDCRSALVECGASCLGAAAAAAGNECGAACATQLRACLASRTLSFSACALQCRSTNEPVRCWQECAGAVHEGASACTTAFRSCLEQCQGPVPDPCACGTPCTSSSGRPGICLPAAPGRACQCVEPACAVSQCIDLRSGRCTGEPCSASQPCSKPEEVCDFLALRCPCTEAKPCTADPDCDDGRPCTLDRCTASGCQHSCVCANAFSCLPWFPAQPPPTPTPTPAPTPEPSPGGSQDVAPCFRTGCSGQVCAERDVVTHCAWCEEYACLRLARCEPQPVFGMCGWTLTEEAVRCMEALGWSRASRFCFYSATEPNSFCVDQRPFASGYSLCF